MAHRELNMPVDLVLVRHGQSEGNLYDEVGRKDGVSELEGVTVLGA